MNIAEVPGAGRGSFIQGSLTHNQRIERLWVDLQRWCTDSYKVAFEWLENNGLLDIDDPIHLWCLHFCYLPMLDQSLNWFATRWNCHKIRMDKGRTPEQLAFQGETSHLLKSNINDNGLILA